MDRGAVCFNPRPLRRAGETLAGSNRHLERVVSIHARSEERAKLRHDVLARRTKCFNPRPLRRAGETLEAARWKLLYEVSIHARSEERAKRVTEYAPNRTALFQSTPAPKSGRNYYLSLPLLCTLWFQSTPAPKSGRNDDPRTKRQQIINVSIHARSEERAKLVGKATTVEQAMVSIHARSEERAKLGCAAARCSCSVFQSTPAPKSGRNCGYSKC